MKSTTSVFLEGLVTDIHPLANKQTTLTDALNGTFVTNNGNEGLFQNDMGNTLIQDSTTGSVIELSKGFIPVGMKEHGGILYIASYNKDTKEGELGTVPSPLINYTIEEIEEGVFEKTELVKSNAQEHTLEAQLNKNLIKLSKTKLHPGDLFMLKLDLETELEEVSRLYLSESGKSIIQSFPLLTQIKDNKPVLGYYTIKLYSIISSGKIVEITSLKLQSYFKKGESVLTASNYWFIKGNDNTVLVDHEKSQGKGLYQVYPNIPSGYLALSIDFEIPKDIELMSPFLASANKKLTSFYSIFPGFKYITESPIQIDKFTVSIIDNSTNTKIKLIDYTDKSGVFTRQNTLTTSENSFYQPAANNDYNFPYSQKLAENKHRAPKGTFYDYVISDEHILTIYNTPKEIPAESYQIKEHDGCFLFSIGNTLTSSYTITFEFYTAIPNKEGFIDNSNYLKFGEKVILYSPLINISVPDVFYEESEYLPQYMQGHKGDNGKFDIKLNDKWICYKNHSDGYKQRYIYNSNSKQYEYAILDFWPQLIKAYTYPIYGCTAWKKHNNWESHYDWHYHTLKGEASEYPITTEFIITTSEYLNGLNAKNIILPIFYDKTNFGFDGMQDHLRNYFLKKVNTLGLNIQTLLKYKQFIFLTNLSVGSRNYNGLNYDSIKLGFIHYDDNIETVCNPIYTDDLEALHLLGQSNSLHKNTYNIDTKLRFNRMRDRWGGSKYNFLHYGYFRFLEDALTAIKLKTRVSATSNSYLWRKPTEVTYPEVPYTNIYPNGTYLYSNHPIIALCNLTENSWRSLYFKDFTENTNDWFNIKIIESYGATKNTYDSGNIKQSNLQYTTIYLDNHSLLLTPGGHIEVDLSIPQNTGFSWSYIEKVHLDKTLSQSSLFYALIPSYFIAINLDLSYLTYPYKSNYKICPQLALKTKNKEDAGYTKTGISSKCVIDTQKNFIDTVSGPGYYLSLEDNNELSFKSLSYRTNDFSASCSTTLQPGFYVFIVSYITSYLMSLPNVILKLGKSKKIIFKNIVQNSSDLNILSTSPTLIAGFYCKEPTTITFTGDEYGWFNKPGVFKIKESEEILLQTLKLKYTTTSFFEAEDNDLLVLPSVMVAAENVKCFDSTFTGIHLPKESYLKIDAIYYYDTATQLIKLNTFNKNLSSPLNDINFIRKQS